MEAKKVIREPKFGKIFYNKPRWKNLSKKLILNLLNN
jgi:hypothetical protein